jgi:enoyl-CoA hydratase
MSKDGSMSDTSPPPLTVSQTETATHIVLDDGKANAMSPPMLAALNEALDTAEAGKKVVVLSGRPGVFSAGFDLKVLGAGGEAATAMLQAGFALLHRLASFPTPIIAVCTGHGLALGSFLLLATDYRIGTAGNFKIGANEVAIGMTMPFAALELLNARINPGSMHRAVTLAEVFTPEGAQQAGFIDEVVDASSLTERAEAVAASLAKLDMAAHHATKLRLRHNMLAAMLSGTQREFPRR